MDQRYRHVHAVASSRENMSLLLRQMEFKFRFATGVVARVICFSVKNATVRWLEKKKISFPHVLVKTGNRPCKGGPCFAAGNWEPSRNVTARWRLVGSIHQRIVPKTSTRFGAQASDTCLRLERCRSCVYAAQQQISIAWRASLIII
jgi:hypothetical protein